MKKKIIITEQSLSINDPGNSFLKREDVALYVIQTKEDAIKTHERENTDLIIVDSRTPSMSSEEFCALIRQNTNIRNVSIILISPDIIPEKETPPECKANAIITRPFKPDHLYKTIQQLLNIRLRAFFRSTLGIKVEGAYNNKPFICFSENISASGMLVESEKDLKEGDRIKCGFYLPDSTHVVSEAEIVRIVEKKNDYDTKKYGIRFLDIKPELIDAIEVFVNGKKKE